MGTSYGCQGAAGESQTRTYESACTAPNMPRPVLPPSVPVSGTRHGLHVPVSDIVSARK